MKIRSVFAAICFSLVGIASHAQTTETTADQVVTAPMATPAPDCKRVCADIQAFLKRDSKNVKTENERWRERLSLKEDVVTYLRGDTAAHGLLKFMARYYVTRAPLNQMELDFLVLLMNKCFPQAVVDIDNARLSELVNILWAAYNLEIESKINSCK